VLSADEIRGLCKQIRARNAVSAAASPDSSLVDEQLVGRIESDVAEYRARFLTASPSQLPPAQLRGLLPLMGWLIYDASLDRLWDVPTEFEKLSTDARTKAVADVGYVRRLANAARGLVWPEFAPRALGAIRAEALIESKRDTEIGYDNAWSRHREADEKYQAFADTLGRLPDREGFLVALDEVLLQLALAETGTACRTAERVLGRWVEDFRQDDREADRRESERWTQKMFAQLNGGIEIGERALAKALEIRRERGFVFAVTEERMTLPTALRNPSIMTCRAILLVYSLCPEMERQRRMPPARTASWAEYQKGLLGRFDRAFAALLEPVSKADGSDWPLNVDHRRSLVQLCLHLGLVTPAHVLTEPVVVDETLTLRTVDDDAVEQLSDWLATEVNGKIRGDANVIGTASKPDFISSVEACRRDSGRTADYRDWRQRWFVLDRYASVEGRRDRILQVLGPGDTL
jgi:hypothetical protein